MRRNSSWVSFMAIAAAATLVSAALGTTVSAAGGTGAYAQWTLAGTSGTVTMESAGFASPSSTFTTNAGNLSIASGASTWLDTSTPFGARYGSSRNKPYLVSGLSSGNPSTTTYTFARPTPVGTWSFAFGDIDADFVTLSARDAAGNPVTSFAGWFEGAFNYSGGADVPTWYDDTATLVGSGNDTNGASGWFTPTVSLSSLTVTFGKITGFPTFQTWFAGDGPTAPVATTTSATSVVDSGATLGALINPNYTLSTVTFRYGTSQAEVSGGQGAVIAGSPSSLSGGDDTTASAIVTGLQPGTTYFFRVEVASSDGPVVVGEVVSFTTQSRLPAVTTGQATNISASGATLNAVVNAGGFPTTPALTYDTDRSVVAAGGGKSASVAPETVTGQAATAVSAEITDLAPDTEYFFQAVASSAQGITRGDIVSFRTLGVPPAPPGQPGVAAGDEEIAVVWTAPEDGGSAAITGYIATAQPGGATCDAPAADNACVISGVTNGTTYTVTVVAASDAGISEPSPVSEPVTPTATPEAAIIISGTRTSAEGDHDRLDVDGVTVGIAAGTQVTPLVGLDGGSPAPRSGVRVVGDDGDFSWTRKVRVGRDATVAFTDGVVTSNTLVFDVTPAIVISGSRQGDRVRVQGATQNLRIGTLLTPLVSLDGGPEQEGVSRRPVRAQGTFTWQRRVGVERSFTVAFTDGSVRSNTVTFSVG